MLDALRFVVSAIEKKGQPELTHFRIKNGRVSGFNGRMALSSPIELDLAALPKADTLIAAVRACPQKEPIALHMTPNNRLAIKSGRFKAFVPCLDNEGATVAPEGYSVDLPTTFFDGLLATAPAMGVDPMRPWSMGVRVQSGAMYAINNIIAVKYWHATPVPLDVIIPAETVNEIIRIGTAPYKAQLTPHSVTFWFAGDRWLRTVLIEPTMWPGAQIEKMLDRTPENQEPVPTDFAKALKTLEPFLSEKEWIHITETTMGTSMYEGDGASIEISLPGVQSFQTYSHKPLVLLSKLARTFEFKSYPAPNVFESENLLGVFCGINPKLVK